MNSAVVSFFSQLSRPVKAKDLAPQDMLHLGAYDRVDPSDLFAETSDPDLCLVTSVNHQPGDYVEVHLVRKDASLHKVLLNRSEMTLIVSGPNGDPLR